MSEVASVVQGREEKRPSNLTPVRCSGQDGVAEKKQSEVRVPRFALLCVALRCFAVLCFALLLLCFAPKKQEDATAVVKRAKGRKRNGGSVANIISIRA